MPHVPSTIRIMSFFPKSGFLAAFAICSCLVWAGASGLVAVPLIAEFMAKNNSTLADEDGGFSDWIEIHNPETTAADLGGYFLTDDAATPAKWRIPDGTTLPPGAYLGVYSLTEKIKRDKNRVDIAKLAPGDTAEPEISGGYIFKQDRQDPGDTGFTVDGFADAYYGKPFAYAYPKEANMPEAQKNWLVAHLNEYKAAVGAPDWTNPATGKHFTEYIDVDS